MLERQPEKHETLAVQGDYLTFEVVGCSVALLCVSGAYVGLTLTFGLQDLHCGDASLFPVQAKRLDTGAWAASQALPDGAPIAFYVPCSAAASLRVTATALTTGPVLVHCAPSHSPTAI